MSFQDHFYLDYVICKFNPKYAVNGTCKLKFVTRLQKSLTLKDYNPRPIANISIHYKLFYRLGYSPLLIDVTANACEFFAGDAESRAKSIALSIILPLRWTLCYKRLANQYGKFKLQSIPSGWQLHGKHNGLIEWRMDFQREILLRLTGRQNRWRWPNGVVNVESKYECIAICLFFGKWKTFRRL